MQKIVNKLLCCALSFVLFFSSSYFTLPKAQAIDDSVNIVNQVVVTIDNDGNQIANIGDGLNIQIDIINPDGNCGAANTVVNVNLTAYGGAPNQPLNCTTPSINPGVLPDIFTGAFPIVDAGGASIDVPAGHPASIIPVTADDIDEAPGGAFPKPILGQTNPIGAGPDAAMVNGVDTKGPVITDANILSIISTDNNTIGVAEVGDVITTTWDDSGGGDNNPDINPATVFVNLTQFGGPALQLMVDGGGVFSFAYTIVPGAINAANLNATISAEDDAQNGLGNIADTSNLTVDSVTVTSRNRSLIYIPFHGAEEFDVPPGTDYVSFGELFRDPTNIPAAIPEEVVSCGCGDNYVKAWAINFNTINNVGLGLDGPQCMNPICLDLSDSIFIEDTPAEATYREAFRAKLDAGKRLRDARDAVLDAQDKYYFSEADFQSVRPDLTRGNQFDYDSKKGNRDAAWRNLQDHKKLLNDAKNDYNQAYWDDKEIGEDSDLIDPARRGQIINEELAGGKKSEQLSSNAFTPELFACFDMSCAENSGSVDPLDSEAWKEATQELNICLDQCGITDDNAFLPASFHHDIGEFKIISFDHDVGDFTPVYGFDLDSEGDLSEGGGIFGQRFDTGLSGIDEEKEFPVYAWPETGSTASEWALQRGNACDPEYESLEEGTERMVLDFFFDPNQFQCFNPVCLDLVDDQELLELTGDSPAELSYRNAFRAKIKAGKKMSDAMDNTLKAKKVYEDGEIYFQNERMDRYEGIGDPDDYDQKKQEADEATANFRVARSAENDARNDYTKAYWDFKLFDEEADDLLGRETKNDIIREELNGGQPEITLTDIVYSCYDPVCGQLTGATYPAESYTEGFQGYNSCVFDDKSLTFSVSELGPLGVSESYEGVKPITLESYGPFTPLNTSGVFVPGSTYASDIFGHPAEPFIMDLYWLGAVDGVGNGPTYGPNLPTTRAALLKVGYNTFGITYPEKVTRQPFIDVYSDQWHAPLFEFGADRKDVLGYGEPHVHFSEREAKPGQIINVVEGLTFLTRIGKVDLRTAEDYNSELVGEGGVEWWHPVWKWAEMNAVVSPDVIQVSFTDADGEQKSGEVQGDQPAQKVSRGKMAELAVKVKSVKSKLPCNCDKEQAAWEDAKQKASDAKAKADADQEAADNAEEKAKTAEDAAKKVDDKVKNLNKFFDESSSATGEDGERITTGDLYLLREFSSVVFEAWAAGEISAEEASKEWEGANKEKLEELRAKKAEELKEAKKAQTEAQAKADAERSKADAAAAKAKKSKEASDDAAKKEADAKKAYDDCLVKCKLVNDKWAEEQRLLEAERRRKAAQRAQQYREEQKRKKAEAERRAREQAARDAQDDPDSQDQYDPPADSSEEEGGGDIPAASKDPCKEKFLEAIAARGKQVAETRPDDVPDAPPALKAGMDFATAVGEMIGGAAQAAAQGSTTAASIASGLASLPNIAYGLWVDYVGGKIKEAGTRIINNRRICAVIKYSTSGTCGYETFPPGQVVYWQKDSSGNYKVVVMGPGDNVTEGQCK